MNKKRTPIITLVIAMFWFVAAPAAASELGNTHQFALEMSISSTGGATAGESATAKFFVGNSRMRMEAAMEGMPGLGVTISVFEEDQVISYVLIPQMKQYMRMVGTMDDYMDEGPGLMFGTPDDADHPCNIDADTTCEKIGTDTILGRSVDQYRVTDIEDGAPTESTIWLDPELGFPLRMEEADGTMEAISVEIGPQPDELFEPPSDYSEMQMQW